MLTGDPGRDWRLCSAEVIRDLDQKLQVSQKMLRFFSDPLKDNRQLVTIDIGEK